MLLDGTFTFILGDNMKVRISWVERTMREIEVEVDSIDEALDTEIVLGEGSEQWIELEDNSIGHEEIT